MIAMNQEFLNSVIEDHLKQLAPDSKNIESHRDSILKKRNHKKYFPIINSLAEYLESIFSGNDKMVEHSTFDLKLCTLPYISGVCLDNYDYLKPYGLKRVRIVVTALKNVHAEVLPPINGELIILINEYLLLSYDLLVRYIVNYSYEKLSKHINRSHIPPNDNYNPMHMVFDNIPNDSDILLKQSIEDFDLYNFRYALSETILTPSSDKRNIDYDELLKNREDKFITNSRYAYHDEFSTHYRSSFVSAFCNIVGHEIIHFVNNHFEINDNKPIGNFPMQWFPEKPTLLLKEFEADFLSDLIADYIHLHICQDKSLIPSAIGSALSVCFSSFIDECITQKEIDNPMEPPIPLLSVAGSTYLIEKYPSIFQSHPLSVERSPLPMAAIGRKVSTYGACQSEYGISIEIAQILWMLSVTGNNDINERQHNYVFDKSRHPLWHQSHLNQRLSLFEELPTEEQEDIIRNISNIIDSGDLSELWSSWMEEAWKEEPKIRILIENKIE